MSVHADPASRVVTIDEVTLDLATAQQVREAALGLDGDVTIDCHAVTVVHDAAVAHIVTSLHLAGRHVELRGLSWPHEQLRRYLEEHER